MLFIIEIIWLPYCLVQSLLKTISRGSVWNLTFDPCLRGSPALSQRQKRSIEVSTHFISRRLKCPIVSHNNDYEHPHLIFVPTSLRAHLCNHRNHMMLQLQRRHRRFHLPFYVLQKRWAVVYPQRSSMSWMTTSDPFDTAACAVWRGDVAAIRLQH